MEIKTCEEYVLRELERLQEENCKLEKSYRELLIHRDSLLKELKTLQDVIDYVAIKSSKDWDMGDSFWVSGFTAYKVDSAGSFLEKILRIKDDSRSE